MDLRMLWENFDVIAEAENGIQRLRDLILELAVRGKLAPQIPEEGSASVILEKLRKSNSNKSKKYQSNFSIDKNKLPFDVPDNWEKVKSEKIILEIRYGMTASADFQDKEIKLLRITDIQNNRVNWESVPGCNGEREKAHRYRLKNGDIVIARTGGTIGKSYLVDNLDENLFAVFASYLIKVSPVEEMNPYYLKLVLESPIYWKQLTGSTMGTGQPNVNATSLKNFTLPLPPLEEQKRIVSKVDELMKRCDRVEESLRNKEELASAISASVIHHLEL